MTRAEREQAQVDMAEDARAVMDDGHTAAEAVAAVNASYGDDFPPPCERCGASAQAIGEDARRRDWRACEARWLGRPWTREQMRERCESGGFELDDSFEWLVTSVQIDGDEVEMYEDWWISLDELTGDELDGLCDAVDELCDGWPRSELPAAVQTSLF